MAGNHRATPRRAAPRTWQQANQGWSGRTVGGTILALGAAAGVGSALMYLFDPQRRPARGAKPAQRAINTLHSGEELLSGAWDTVSHRAHDAAAAIGESLPSHKSIADTADDARETAGSWFNSARQHLPSL